MTIGIFPNYQKKDSKKILERVISFFHAKDIDIFVPEEKDAFTGYQKSIKKVEKLDIGISIGGDGTLLGVCRLLAPHDIPVCGVNIGNLGFLADIEITELENKLQKILSHNYNIEQRLMLAGYIKENDDYKLAGYAVNDIVLTSAGVARMIGLRLGIDAYKIPSYHADGLIVSSSTGSTAYSLSAGGPIINPNVKVLLITPICPHSFYVRPMIVNETAKLSVSVKDTRQNVILSFDGQEVCPLPADKEILICKAPFSAKIIKFDDKNYYKILLNKLVRGNENADTQQCY